MSMADTEIRNATITDTFLGVEDHGLLIWSIVMDYGDNSEQGYQLILASKVDALSVNAILELLEAVGVDSWEHLKGKNVRCVIENRMIRSVGHITRNTWFKSSAGTLADSTTNGH